LSLRLYEQNLLDKAHSLLVPKEIKQPRKRKALEHPLFVLDTVAEESYRCDGNLRKHKIQNVELNNKVQEWLCNGQTVIKKEKVVIYSQLFLDEYDLLFRATPNHQGTGKWDDWVLVNFIDSSERSICYPFKNLGFIQKDDCTGPICFGQSPAEIEISSHGLFEHWHLESRQHGVVGDNQRQPVHRFVELDSIKGPCLCIQLSEVTEKNAPLIVGRDPNDEFTRKVVLVKDRQDEWPELFLTGMDRIITNKGKRKKKRRKR
jgi:hypothetical protein